MKVHETLPIVPIERGEGAWLIDFDGNRYLDAVSSWWVNLFGHAHPRINAALIDQLAKLEHVILAGFTHAPVVALAERLAAIAPGRLGHAFFASDGASAVEIALKMSFHYWRNNGHERKREFVSLANGYHGETLGALSVTDVDLFRNSYAPLLRESRVVPSPDARGAREGKTSRDVAESAARALEIHVAAHHQHTAALIVEPLVQGAAGMAMYDAHYLRRARDICTRYRVHLIADEIMTGFGRTGTMFACEQAGIAPDFLLLSKGITGGYLPLACVLATEEVYAAFYADDLNRAFLHSHSYAGNALACRAALAVLDLFDEENVVESNRGKALRFNRLAGPLAGHRKVGAFRNLGMIWAFEVDTTRTDFARWFFSQALSRGVLLRPIDRTVYFMPPYVTDDAEFAGLVDAALAILDAA
ncbi:MAG TPA: adenosylmethionine--8-amino-7-oxononanoate transaminase [Casimicrobiaceae bacterium]|nr:adenosylmethionine--8-amino-7-oxononanoate transaminase [Casimicrobiaceae bacterium]